MPYCFDVAETLVTQTVPSPGDAGKAAPNAVLDEPIESISRRGIMVCVLERALLQDAAEFSVPAASPSGLTRMS